MTGYFFFLASDQVPLSPVIRLWYSASKRSSPWRRNTIHREGRSTTSSPPIAGHVS